jgi:glycosyltransferase involved in cell wall biosynthesis
MSRRICLVIPNLQSGGMERVMSELAHYFCGIGLYDVHLVLYGIKTEIFYKLPPNIQIHCSTIEFNKNIRFISTIRTLFFLRLKIKSINPDSVLTFGELWNSFVLIALFGTKFRVFLSDRCQPNKKWGRHHEWLRKKLYPRAAGIIYQTKLARDISSREVKIKNFAIIGNPIMQFSCEESLTKEKVVLSVGRLIKSKNHDQLIEIFASINNPEWKLIIVGDDAQLQNNMIRLKELVVKLNMEDNIILTGKRSDIDKFYCSSSIFAFTSSSEGFPNVIGEAMSSGLPVVAYDCIAGPSEMINDGESGFLIKLNDVDDFKVKLQILMNDSYLRRKMGESGREFMKKFDLQTIGKRFEEFLFPPET